MDYTTNMNNFHIYYIYISYIKEVVHMNWAEIVNGVIQVVKAIVDAFA